ncbi:bifunctional 2-polyprenyl-6-hydroxyphenol methylase/3-demethylubiquinol 3-O-methyltransferase UbiG [Nakamurella sp. PAMC28650]|uniref:class I SAM-dependent methyltransferase n=1 Tax=Nakamurella sp. PAMC28650 TaxID=2762325 RepID=UPI00164E9BCB|nr:class I SAM-dependent methyltransferase [Nakamurella sp. PAMC28650]QNK80973.1 class I SAM-dependent methyltransferase [Nakamurella sp. PAMC28650]
MAIKEAVRSAYLSRSSRGRSPGGIKLPPSQFRMGGKHFQTDAGFVSEARKDVARLLENGYSPSEPLLDWGCGAGRLAVGALETLSNFVGYDGVDVQADLIRWAQRHIARPGVTFKWVDVSNARYNPRGTAQRVIPGGDGHYGTFYAYSVFSRMVTADVQGYLSEILRLLRPTGFAFVTAFVESDVAKETENPQGYGPLVWRGPLHCVRSDLGYFTEMVERAGLRITGHQHGTETDGQSAMILRPA